MSRESFLERWSRLKKVADQVPADGIVDAEALLRNLGPDSDFGVFLREEVSEDIRRQAMKKLFADPHFNVMDRLDTYIDDYSISDPIPPEMLAGLRQMQDLVEPEDAAGESPPVVSATASEPPAEAAIESPVLAAAVDSSPPPDQPEACDILAGDGQNDPEISKDKEIGNGKTMT
ncbi:MAG TPA: DUF3306 domain-containing protein [Rhodocyclaceae bacterium]|nr:DUF3306 domain-containing protein [Rhodocyclaceae bacterium]